MINICISIRYPTKIPLVVEKHKAEKSLTDIDKVEKLNWDSVTRTFYSD